MYYLQSRYYDPNTGRFLNADDFVSTGQGILSNNMYTYCHNSPVNNADINGKWTITIGSGISATCFVGVSASKSITLDENGISYQYSESSPEKRETTTVGLLSAGHAFFIQITNKDSASELEGVSTYLGLSLGETGIDIVGDKPVASQEGELIGVQISLSAVSTGVDVHVAQTETITTGFVSWEDIWQGIIDWFGF